MTQETFRLSLYGHLWRFTEEKSRSSQRPLHGGLTVAELLRELGIPQQQVMIVLINGKRASEEQPIEPSDHIEVLPVIDGG
jgi:sulfur carrier protein ThiS